jgi:hypothetical protein
MKGLWRHVVTVRKGIKVQRNLEIGELFLDGYTANEIGRMMGISKQRVSFILHNLGIRAEEEFTTVILPQPMIVALDFGDAVSEHMIGWSKIGLIPKPDQILETTREKAHETLRELSKLPNVCAYIPIVEGEDLPGREIRSDWLVYAYPLKEARLISSVIPIGLERSLEELLP